MTPRKFANAVNIDPAQITRDSPLATVGFRPITCVCGESERGRAYTSLLRPEPFFLSLRFDSPDDGSFFHRLGRRGKAVGCRRFPAAFLYGLRWNPAHSGTSSNHAPMPCGPALMLPSQPDKRSCRSVEVSADSPNVPHPHPSGADGGRRQSRQLVASPAALLCGVCSRACVHPT